MTPPLDTASVLTAYAPATKRLILFDYDGTLTPIVCNAADATLSTHQFKQLEKLASSSENAVWVISGRDQTFLKAQLGSLSKVGLVAEHGAFIRRPETEEWQELVIGADMGWQSIVQQVFEDFRSRHEGSFIEEKRVATVLHYRKVELQHLAEKDAIECKKSLEQALVWWPANVIRGKCVLEARPAYTDKGQIVRRIFDELTHEIGYLPEFVFCVGDDVTDEGEKFHHDPLIGPHKESFSFRSDANALSRHVSRIADRGSGFRKCLHSDCQ